MSADRKFAVTCLVLAFAAGVYGAHEHRRAAAFASVTEQVLVKTTAALQAGIDSRDKYCAALKDPTQ